MFDRNELLIELGALNLAEIEEELWKTCKAAHLPVIYADNLLENLPKNGSASRIELYHAIHNLRKDCLLLNQGAYLLTAVEKLNKTLISLEKKTAGNISRL